MSINLTFPKSCCCLSLRPVAVIIGLGGLAVGLLFYVRFLYIAIHYSDIITSSADTRPDLSIFEVIEHLTFMYPEAMKIIFSVYLIYGALKNYPMKTCYIAAWLIYEGVLSFVRISDLFVNLKHLGIMFFAEEFIIFVFCLGMMYLVFSYYYNLPKKSFEAT